MVAWASQRRVNPFRPVLEVLEDRTLLNAVSLIGGIISASGGNPSSGGTFPVALGSQTSQRRFLTSASLRIDIVNTNTGIPAAPAVTPIPGSLVSTFGVGIGLEGRNVTPAGGRTRGGVPLEGPESSFFIVGLGGEPDEGWGVISGRVFESVGPGSSPDVGGPGLAGQTVTVAVQTNGMFVPLRTTTTDARGEYSFIGLGPGVYRVELQGCSRPELCRHDVALTEGAKVPDVNFGKLRRGAALPPPATDRADILPADLEIAPVDRVFREWNPADMVIPSPGMDHDMVQPVIEGGEKGTMLPPDIARSD